MKSRPLMLMNRPSLSGSPTTRDERTRLWGIASSSWQTSLGRLDSKLADLRAKNFSGSTELPASFLDLPLPI